jgi:hypothetical protein
MIPDSRRICPFCAGRTGRVSSTCKVCLGSGVVSDSVAIVDPSPELLAELKRPRQRTPFQRIVTRAKELMIAGEQADDELVADRVIQLFERFMEPYGNDGHYRLKPESIRDYVARVEAEPRDHPPDHAFGAYVCVACLLQFIDELKTIDALKAAAFSAIEAQPPGDDTASITCPGCGSRSYNEQDIRAKYCGFCHTFHDGTARP